MAALDLSTVFLCFTVALCVFAFLGKPARDWDPDGPLRNKRVYWAAVAALFLVAVAVRAAKFGAIPDGVNQDGAMAAVDAKALADYGTDRFGMKLPVYFTAWGYAEMGVLLSYLMVPFIKIFGLTIVAARLPVLLISLLSLVVFFQFARKLFGPVPALLALFFLAINPWHIMQSRWALESNLFPHFLLFALYFLYLGLERRPFLYLSMAFFALTMYTYGIAFYTVPLLLVALCAYLLIKRRVKPWEAALCAAVYLALAWPILADVVVNYFSLPTIHAGFLTIPAFPDTTRKDDLLFFCEKPLEQLFENLNSFVEMVVLARGDFTWNMIDGYGHLYPFSLPFVAAGLALLLRRRGRRGALPDGPVTIRRAERPDGAGRFLLLAWLALSLFTGLVVNDVNTNRINLIFYPLCLLAALGLHRLLFLRLRVKKIALAVAVLYLFSFTTFTASYFGEHAEEIADDFCAGFVDAVRYADGLDADTLYITSDTRGEDSYNVSEILTLFATGMDARYFQGTASAAGEDGALRLPYTERYLYTDFRDFPFTNRQDVVYVFNLQESDYFSEEFYEVTPFGNFAVAVPYGNLPLTDEEQDGPQPGDEQQPPPGDSSEEPSQWPEAVG